MNSLINNYIAQIKEIQNGQPWVGQTYEKLLKNITPDNAFIRPKASMHSVAELLSHCAMWREEAVLKITTGHGSKTDDAAENWLSNQQLKAIGWTTIIDRHHASIAMLLQQLAKKEDAFLKERYYDLDFKGHFPYEFLINGMLHHDIYHLGQMALVWKYLNQLK